jgi:uncharacterized phage protein (predicted DNA packaging)
MAFIDDVKKVLRISSSAFDTEISNLISAAQEDLKIFSIVPEKVVDTDPLVRNAIITYVKAQFGWDNPDAEKLMTSYESQKSALALVRKYNGYTITFSVTSSGALADATVEFQGQKQITNSSGQAVFLGVQPNQNQKYVVSKETYTTVNGEVDVSVDATVNVAMVVS